MSIVWKSKARWSRYIKNILLIIDPLLAKPFEVPIITDWDSINDGLKFKQCVKDRVIDSSDPLQQFVVSDDDEEKELAKLLEQFPPEQRKRLLK